MPILSTLAAFFRRHKRKLMFTSAASVTAYLLFHQLVIKRFRNFQNSLRQELYVKEQIKRRYIQTQTDCYLTILALLPVLTHPIMVHLPTESITSALKRKKNVNREMSDSLTTENLLAHSEENPSLSSLDMQHLMSKSKLELWNDLKVKSISRILALIYSSSGLLLLTRLQLNILARKSYLELAIAMAGGSPQTGSQNSYDYFIEQSYLSLSWWLLNHGWLEISDRIEKLVERKFSGISPKTEMTMEKFSQMLSEINDDVFSDIECPVMHLIYPIKYDDLIETLMSTNPELVSELEGKDLNLVKLVNETNYVLTDAFTLHVFSKLVQSGLSTLYENILIQLNPESQAGRANKLATFLAQLSVQSAMLGDSQSYSVDSEIPGNAYINKINDVDELEEFSASIYSNFE
ncbi:peroxisomal biogenesis factor 3 [Metschnikowia bicuspidata var. bicuspidata NRRL YB-4993]|uniref:Peroxin-3 n=1 Tax=Metschnikowia bicuspidata var. bicuspidata NRRL YB-4993 TaxID=869754 RepID=A0A1A0H7N0_9ASCO|nr:peroxisomal biogenesis factor 3 [Metschnikowia bicuspidata var. bicuspidata NRRL YB-4993]OBA20104.1 peroxisomal biogenesis factor 3 [Metschnikowia bicuspidata var. bicuspidata NRRL YB-4993]